eukprot:3075328-Prymnesium_polylepis.1
MRRFHYSSIVLVHALDAYGSGAALAMQQASQDAGLELSVVVSFLENAVDVTEEVGQLQRYVARVIVLFSQPHDGSHF